MRLCSGPGCGRAIPEDQKFCDECRSERSPVTTDDVRDHSNSYTEELDKLRKSPRWQNGRARVIKEQPICAICNRALSEICDHIVPAGIALQQARDSGRFPFDRNAGYFIRSNLQGLCRECHYKKTLEDKLHTGPWPDVVAKEDARPKKVWRF